MYVQNALVDRYLIVLRAGAIGDTRRSRSNAPHRPVARRGSLETLVGDRTSTAQLAAYVDQSTGQPVYVPRGQNPQKTDLAIKLAQAYWRDVKSIESSPLGKSIRNRTRGYTPLEIRASGVQDLESRWRGAVQTTTFLPDGTGFYTRDDPKHYTRKLALIGELHAETPELIHEWVTIHEYIHGRGVRSEQENHQIAYAAIEDELERTADPRENHRLTRLLNVQARELELRFGVKKPIRAPRERTLN
jgi:hypothetical protein